MSLRLLGYCPANYDAPWRGSTHFAAPSSFLARERSSLPHVVFQFHERGTNGGIQRLASKLDRQRGRIPNHVGKPGKLEALQNSLGPGLYAVCLEERRIGKRSV